MDFEQISEQYAEKIIQHLKVHPDDKEFVIRMIEEICDGTYNEGFDSGYEIAFNK